MQTYVLYYLKNKAKCGAFSAARCDNESKKRGNRMLFGSINTYREYATMLLNENSVSVLCDASCHVFIFNIIIRGNFWCCLWVASTRLYFTSKWLCWWMKCTLPESSWTSIYFYCNQIGWFLFCCCFLLSTEIHLCSLQCRANNNQRCLILSVAIFSVFYLNVCISIQLNHKRKRIGFASENDIVTVWCEMHREKENFPLCNVRFTDTGRHFSSSRHFSSKLLCSISIACVFLEAKTFSFSIMMREKFLPSPYILSGLVNFI